LRLPARPRTRHDSVDPIHRAPIGAVPAL